MSKVYENVKYSNVNKRNVLDLYIPNTDEFDVLVYFHGGGLEYGNKDGMNTIAKSLNECGIAVVAPNYRVYPEAVYPEFIEDAAASVAWVKENISQYGNAKRIFVGGSSAGAYLTAMLAYASGYLKKWGIDTTDISGYIINSTQPTTHFNVLRERGLNTSRIVVDEAAPIFYIDEGIKFPNVMILFADNDMPCRYEQNMMFVKTLEIFGCPKDKMKFVVMKNSTHCSYDNTSEYHNLLSEFIKG